MRVSVPTGQTPSYSQPLHLREEPVATSKGEAKGVQTEVTPPGPSLQGCLKGPVVDDFFISALFRITIFRCIECQIQNAFDFYYVFIQFGGTF